MGPFRSAPGVVTAEAPRDAGIVGDVIGQFADPLAFYRELVQNAIDAGTPSIEVTLVVDRDAAVVRATVRDRGEGMSRDIVEDQLLVLFRSTKEHDRTKIGKFGIGFASVLSPQPSVVVVQTVRDGRRLILHLYPDLNYELFDGGAAQRSGTSVELEVPVAPDQVAGFVRRSHQALLRWCRHASVPIALTARGAGDADLHEVRIDRPLGLDDALVEVHGASSDGLLTAVVGLTATATPYAGFFNHGLMLHESDQPTLGGLSFKVQDARLGHTISRDNVRRDDAFAAALGFVETLAATRLPAACATALRGLAEAGDRRRYRELADALGRAGIAVAGDAWTLPLLAPLGERRSVEVATLPRHGRLIGARERTPVSEALAAAGIAVIDLGPAGLDGDWLIELVRARCERELVDVAGALTHVAPIELSGSDLALRDGLAELLAAVHRAPSAIVLATLTGARRHHVAITGGPAVAMVADGGDDAPWILDAERTGGSPFGLLRRPTLVLDVGAAVVAAARRRAVDDPVTAAAMLARAVLLQFGALDVERSAALLDASLARLGVGSAR